MTAKRIDFMILPSGITIVPFHYTPAPQGMLTGPEGVKNGRLSEAPNRRNKTPRAGIDL